MIIDLLMIFARKLTGIFSYGGVVYDVTNFVANHPGGSERILLAAGSVSFLYNFIMSYLLSRLPYLNIWS